MKGIKSIIPIKCKDSDIPKIIKDKDCLLTAPKDIANSSNTFFCSVPPNIHSKINFAHKSLNYFLKNKCNKSVFIRSFTNKEIIDVISDLSSSKTTEPNSKKIAKNFTSFQKRSKLECSNYRPILLLSSLDKFIEKLMHKRVMEFLNEQKIFYFKQYGFRNVFQVLSLINNLFVEFLMTCKKHLMQLITTFYLKKYNKNGIRGIAHQWLNLM